MRLIRVLSAAALTAGVVMLSGCAPAGGDSGAGTAVVDRILAEHGWSDLGGAALVEALEELPVDERPAELMASVTANAVTLSAEDGSTRRLELDDFSLSVAPYVSQTHPCTFHSLTTCRGELSAAPVDIVVTDASSGAVVAQHGGRTHDNGFAGVWLPRDGRFTVTAQSAVGVATTEVRTGADDSTCLTTMQLR